MNVAEVTRMQAAQALAWKTLASQQLMLAMQKQLPTTTPVMPTPAPVMQGVVQPLAWQQAQLMQMQMQMQLQLQAQQMSLQHPHSHPQPQPAAETPSPLPSPGAEPLPAPPVAKGRSKSRGNRRKAKQSRGDERAEKRVDPTDGRRYTQREFLMRHAVGADFSKGDALWADAGRALAAVQPVRRPRAKASRPAAAPRVRFSEVLDVVECSSEAAAAAPSFARPAKSVLKSRSATPAPVSDCFADALTA
eukprot:TRINITY_DN344_c0_g1_i2.p1 TRINITY_DN344_c0_g1~~TRINITY_DN344_c0_g1_i2.p1  ORF type:complete len:248 (+),score=67.25 TRINITY_DN344_c0_g1_i2:70-813(+)